MDQLRAIVRRSEERWFEAQLLELDIAVSADSFEGIIRELQHAIIVEYQVAKELGHTPFANVVVDEPPAELARWWMAGSKGNSREVALPAVVFDALKIALHAPKQPVFVVQQLEYKKAA